MLYIYKNCIRNSRQNVKLKIHNLKMHLQYFINKNDNGFFKFLIISLLQLKNDIINLMKHKIINRRFHFLFF